MRFTHITCINSLFFLLLSSIPLYEWITIGFLFTCWGTFGFPVFFYYEEAVKFTSLCQHKLSFLFQMKYPGIAKSYARCMYNFVRDCQIIFPSGYFNNNILSIGIAFTWYIIQKKQKATVKSLNPPVISSFLLAFFVYTSSVLYWNISRYECSYFLLFLHTKAHCTLLYLFHNGLIAKNFSHRCSTSCSHTSSTSPSPSPSGFGLIQFHALPVP